MLVYVLLKNHEIIRVTTSSYAADHWTRSVEGGTYESYTLEDCGG